MNLTPKNERLFNNYLESRPKELSDKTIYNYHYSFYKFQDTMNINDLKMISIKDLQKRLSKSDLNHGLITKMLIILKTQRPTDKDELDLLVSKYSKSQKKKTDERTKQEINSVSFENLKSILNKIEGVNYLWFYILFEYGVRLMDLQMLYTDSDEVISDVSLGEIAKNIVFFKGNKCYYTRNHYKTNDNYGVITLQITDKKFIETLKTLPVNEFVIRNKQNEPIETNQLNTYVKRTLNKILPDSNLTESKIYKIVIDHYHDNNDKLVQYAKTRPHNIQTQVNTYS